MGKNITGEAYKNGLLYEFINWGNAMTEQNWEILHRKEVARNKILTREIEILMKKLQKEKNRSCEFRRGIKAVRELMNESSGVAGLHMNDDVATWADLEQGGTFEEWLLDFNKAEDFLGV